MTQEEKARAYDKVSKEVKDFFEGKQKMYSDVTQTLEYLFPELKENEDERIRKRLIVLAKGSLAHTDGEINEMIAWLEKQKSVGEIVLRCKNSWYNEGKIQGQIEGLSDEEKYQQGWHDALEKQGEKDKKEINNFEVIPGLYKCVYRMFDGTPDGNLLFEIGNVYKCLSKHDRAEFEISYGHSVYLEDPVVCKHFIPFEKQDEQKSIDEIKPKFKVSDWVVNNNSGGVCQVTEIRDDEYCLWPLDAEIVGYLRIIDVDNEYHLWSIKDAKSGDMLANDHHILILKELVYDWYSNGIPDSVKAYCGIKPSGNFEIGKDNWCFCGTLHIHPATKEQRDTLMKAMADAGYIFDFEKKELRNIEQKSVIKMKTPEESLGISSEEYNKIVDECIYGDDKSTRGQEDEQILKAAILHIKNETYNCCGGYSSEDILQWLKSFKPQSKQDWKPSDEQIEALEHFVRSIGESGFASPYEDNTNLVYSLLSELKKLKG